MVVSDSRRDGNAKTREKAKKCENDIAGRNIIYKVTQKSQKPQKGYCWAQYQDNSWNPCHPLLKKDFRAFLLTFPVGDM